MVFYSHGICKGSSERQTARSVSLRIRILCWCLRLCPAVAAMASGLLVLADPGTVQAGNVLLFIGDGMGPEQVRAARYYYGQPLFFETLPNQAQCTTFSADSSVTDSAAAATALATGVKVDNGVLSMAYPGDGRPLQTLLEYAQARNMRVGLVSTAYLTHATPAAFGAHETSRNNYDAIASDYLDQTRPNVLFGGGGNGLTVSATLAAGYRVATDSLAFQNLDLTQPLLSAQFGSSHLPYVADYLDSTYPFPQLADLVATALEALEDHPQGMFLMIEGGRIDHAGHDNHLPRAVHETLAFSTAVETAMVWAALRRDTLVLVTADHETGGLKVTRDNGPGAYPDVTWSTTGHTGVNVPIYAWGRDAQLVSGVLDNTELFLICRGVLGYDAPRPPSAPQGLRIVSGQTPP